MCDGSPVSLQPKIFDTLVLLLERPGKLIGKAEMTEALWPGTFVGDSALTKNISDLRKALADRTGDVSYIQTVPGSGYRFVTPVEVVDRAEIASVAPVVISPITRFPGARPLWAITMAGILLVAGVMWLLVSRRPAANTDHHIQSMAVLPFRPMSAQQRDEYLELGMADTLISQLSANGRLVVRSASSVREYASAGKNSADVGRQLRVDAVLEGNVQKLDNSVRVTARLIRVKDGALLWSGSFDGAFANLFAVQDSLARQVMAALSLDLTPARQNQVSKRTTENVEAWEWYQKGRFFAGRRTPEGFDKAIACYQQAIARDPRDALAWSGLSDAHMLTAWYYTRPVKAAHALARDAAVRALALDDSLAEAHTSMAVVHENAEWEFRAADHEFRRALQLNPNYVTAHHWYGEFLGLMAHPSDALAHLHRARELDPLSLIIGADTAKVLVDARRYGEAIEECRRTLELDPAFRPARGWMRVAYTWSRMYREAQAATDMLEKDHDTIDGALGEAVFYKAAGNSAKAGEFLRKFRQMADREPPPAWQMVVIYLLVQPDTDKALEWLQTAYDERNPYMMSLKVAQEFDPIRSDPRFQDLVRRMNFLD